MTREQIENLHKLSPQEKYEAVMMLWDDLAESQNAIPMPSNHKRILEERIADFKSGTTRFKAWEEIKSKYLPEK